MTKTEEAGGTTDPYEIWRQMYESNERVWSSALEQAMSSAEYSESSGRMLETMLAAQKSVRDNMRTYLETMNVPTREDIARLGELVVALEEKVDQVVDRLDGLEAAVRAQRAGPAGPTGPAGSTGPAGPTGPVVSGPTKAGTRVAPATRGKGPTTSTSRTRRKPAKPAKPARPAK